MRSILVHSGFWKYVNGCERLDSTWSEEQKANWVEKDEKALATIVLGLKGTQLNYIKKCTRSAEAWNKLGEVHKPKGPIQKVMLFKKLMSLKMDETEQMCQYLNKFQDVIENMAEVGIKMADELMVIVLMSSLPMVYEPFIVAMETRDSLPSFEVLKLKLLDEGNRKRNSPQDAEGEGLQGVYAAKTKNWKKVRGKSLQDADSEGSERSYETNWRVKKSGGRRTFYGKCYNCGRRGHYERNCQEKMEDGNESGKTIVNGRCYSCGRRGHYARDCQEKEKFEEAGAAAVLSVVDKGFRKGLWYVDSGATSHMCNDIKLFQTLKPCNEEIFLAADKRIFAKGKGDVIINGECEVRLQNVLFSPELQGNFISISKAVENGCTAVFDSVGVKIKNRSGRDVIKAKKEAGLFVFCQAIKHRVFGASNKSVEKVSQGIRTKNGFQKENLRKVEEAQRCKESMQKQGRDKIVCDGSRYKEWNK